MGAMLFCKRLVCRPNLCRSITCDNSGPRPTERLFLSELDQWCKKKDPWVDDWKHAWRRTRDPEVFPNLLSIQLALTKKKEGKYALAQNATGIQCFVSNKTLLSEHCYILRLIIMDLGPRAYEDGHRTLAFNQFLRGHLSDRINKASRRIPGSFFTQMIINGAIPDVDTFSILIRHYCKFFKYECILDIVYTQMKALGVEADDVFCRSLISGVCARFGPNVGYQLLKELRTGCGIQMPLSCYDAIVRQFCKRSRSVPSSNLLELIDVLMDMKQQQHFPDDRIYDYLMKWQCYHSGESFIIKTAGIGRQMFTQGLKIGAVSNIVVVKKRSRTP